MWQLSASIPYSSLVPHILKIDHTYTCTVVMPQR